MTHVALVGDVNDQAYNTLNVDYNFVGYPTVFYDAGDTVGVGGSSLESYYRGRIEACGARVVTPLDLIVRIDLISGTNYELRVKVGNGVPANRTPELPVISGPTATEIGILNSYTALSTDLDADQLYYQYDIDGTISEWFGPFSSGVGTSLDKTWSQNGTYSVKVRTKDEWNVETEWSPSYSVQVGCCVTERGNVDGDNENIIDISDLVFLVDFMFTNGPSPICLYEGNVDGDLEELIDISDLVFLVDFMFTGGPTPSLCLYN